MTIFSGLGNRGYKAVFQKCSKTKQRDQTDETSNKQIKTQ